MKILLPDNLADFRATLRCEWCGVSTHMGADPHHITAKGIGAGRQLDCRANLVGLCRHCHDLVGIGRIGRESLLVVVAEREGLIQWDVPPEIAYLEAVEYLERLAFTLVREKR